MSIRFKSPKAVDADQVRNFHESGKFSLLENFSPGMSTSFEKGVPLYSKKSDHEAYVRMEQLSLGEETGGRRIFFFSIESCAANSCARQQEKLASKAEDLGNWKFLPSGLEIIKVYFGDGNKDGVNDILLEMSNGAGFVIFSNKSVPKGSPKNSPMISEKISGKE